MAEVGIPGEEDAYDLDGYSLRTIANCTDDELARARQRIADLTQKGVIKPNAFDPLDQNRKLRWPQPVPRGART